MNRVGRILPAAVPSKEVLVAAKAQILFRDWESIVGETLARKSWPDRYAKGTVWVAVEGSAWATELRMRKGEILERLAQKAGDPNLFKDIRFGVRPLPPRAEAEPFQDPPEIVQESVTETKVEELSIREIAERRLKKWQTQDPG
jgi:hypothetical protein